MAEAVKPRSRAKSSRARAKEKKKKCEEEAKAEPGAFLPSAARSREESSQSADAQEERLTEARLQNETSEREKASDARDVPLSASAPVNEGSLGDTQTTLPAQAEESGPKALQGEDAAENSAGLPNLRAASLGETVACGLMESTIPCTPLPVGAEQDREAENVQNPPVKTPVVRSSEEAPFTLSAPKEDTKGHVGTAGSKRLYPDLASELSRERAPVLAVKPQLPKGRLYPAVPLEPELAPFTREQLKLFEPCSWLENVDSYAEEFEGLAHQDRHEFYELLLNYWRCRKQLLLAEAKLQTLSSDCRSVRDRLWTFKDEQQSAQVE
ncbi:UNVERIFIED_CONTAM: hypothetical protein K2H54_069767 [Gekko kuhli]